MSYRFNRTIKDFPWVDNSRIQDANGNGVVANNFIFGIKINRHKMLLLQVFHFWQVNISQILRFFYWHCFLFDGMSALIKLKKSQNLGGFGLPDAMFLLQFLQ